MSWGAWELWEVKDPRVAESWLLSSGPTRGAERLPSWEGSGAWGNQIHRSWARGAHLDQNCLFSTSPGPARLHVRSRPAEVAWSDPSPCVQKG